MRHDCENGISQEHDRAHAPLPFREAPEVTPSCAEFRETVELLDRRANTFDYGVPG